MTDQERDDDSADDGKTGTHRTEELTGSGEGGTDMKSDAGEDDGGVETEGDGDVKDDQKPTTE